MNRIERENREGKEFDHGAPPPFKLADVRAAIPEHCWVKDPWKSMGYVVRDLVVVFALIGIAVSLDSWFVWPFYWFAQGTMFGALFVIGHDWRISHRIHHANHAHVENDESWRPMTETLYKGLPNWARMFRYTAPFPLFVAPYYLAVGEPGKKGSHFIPKSELFVPSDKWDVISSTIYCCVMVALLAALGFAFGHVHLLNLYGLPYMVSIHYNCCY
ncbi:hypothetical protein Cgig2_021946 [Carnegiea gigantea]|uniref:Fatty acid desaturase N-terminal domain-containing protein n=1 Tax=Carnegiea gigantea TaxID=171969 RepID=A0A9Q1QMM9_9CARY|nr:hypothetical protein Cgig2_021946 [Carnegiea gigantea]